MKIQKLLYYMVQRFISIQHSVYFLCLLLQHSFLIISPLFPLNLHHIKYCYCIINSCHLTGLQNKGRAQFRLSKMNKYCAIFKISLHHEIPANYQDCRTHPGYI